MRLTEQVRNKLLEMNEGFKCKTSYDSRNSSYVREYVIKEGKLIIREIGKTSWADSRYDKVWEASKDELLRFLRANKNKLKK